MDVFQYGFMQRAFIAGVFVGIICPLMGVFLVLRRMSMVGDALAHISLTGIAVGLVLGVNPTITSLVMATAGTLGIEYLRQKYAKFAELAIAIAMSAGLGTAVLLISYGKGTTAGILGYLFGSIVAVTELDLMLVAIVTFIVGTSVIFFYRQLFYMTFDEEAAKLAGISLKSLNILFALLTALTVAGAMRVVGVLLVSSMMILPVATALRVARSFKQVVFCAIIQAQISIFAGLMLSFYLNLAPGGTIVITSLILLIITMGSGKLHQFGISPTQNEPKSMD